MGDDRPRYYRVRRERAFWEPGAFAEQFGLPKSQPLGPDSAEAKAAALKWNERLDEARQAARAGEPIRKSKYPPGTLGAFFDWYRTTEAWSQREPATRDDYERAWPHIEKRFGTVVVTRITATDSERFHVDVHPAHPNKRDPANRLKLTPATAHRVLKVWRTLLTALVDYRLIAPPAPIGRVSNPGSKGRSAIWLHEEVLELAKAAEAIDQPGMAVAIRLAWDTMLSPVDVRMLTLAGWSFKRGASEINTARKKTQRPVLVAVPDETAELVEAYLARLRAAGIEVAPDLPIIRQQGGKPFPNRGRFAGVFRQVRAVAFPGDDRQFLDIRRSAMTEATLGGATREDIGAAAANEIAKSEVLKSTYLRAASRRILDAREKGRAPMRTKFGAEE